MTTSLNDLTQRLLQAAQSAGADAADAIAVSGRSVQVGVLDGALEQAERSESTEIGLRVLVGQRQAMVAASDISRDTLAEMAERAVAMARLAPEDPTLGLADAVDLARETGARELDLIDETPAPSPEALQEAALEAEAAAAGVPGVSRVQSAAAGQSETHVHLAASNGFSGAYGRTSHGMWVSANTGEGTNMERDGYGDSRCHAADLPSPDEIGRIAGDRAAARAGARKPPTGAFPVLFDERIASSLVGHLLAAINGTAITRGASWLGDAMDQPVLPNGLSLIEDPRRPRVPGSRPFDAEGLPTARREIVADGVLRSWLLDLGTARKLGLRSTANASRSPGGPPSPAAGNIALTQGAESRADLIAGMGTGLLVTGLIGASINPTTGDYSRGASGFWIENGEITHPVNECTIAGNLRPMLASLRPANDARPHLSRVVPSLLVEGMTIAGA